VEFENYYFGEVYFDPPFWDVISFVQGIGIVINPLTPGEHMIELHAFFAQDACLNGMETSFDNTWTITVTPQGQGSN